MASHDRESYFPAIEKKYGQPMSYWFDQMAEIKDRKYPEQIAFLRENHGFSQAHANALVMYCRGSKSSRRYDTVEQYLEGLSETEKATVTAILDAITTAYPQLHPVIAWNQPMLKLDGQYIFGLSVQAKHILIAPFRTDVIEEFAPRLAGYKVNKKTIQVPSDWQVDEQLLQDMVGAGLPAVDGT